MLYLSGIHALNIPCKLDTGGDLHRTAIRWDVIEQRLLESNDSVFKDYGIEKNKKLVFLDGEPIYHVANHIRACLDLLEQGNFSIPQGMRNDFIVTSRYDEEIFNKVLLLQHLAHWHKIDDFMASEYKMKWIHFKEKKKIQPLRKLNNIKLMDTEEILKSSMI